MPEKKEIFILVLAGISAGLFLTFYPAGLFIILLFLCCLFLIKAFIKTVSTGFLIKLFIISFALRALFCVVNYNVGLNPPFWGGDTQPDATVYSGNAFYIAHLLKENTAENNLAMDKDPFLVRRMEIGREYYGNELPKLREYQIGSYVYMLGIFYAWLGYAPVAAKMLNGLFCCISMVVVYLISRNLFKEERAARISAAIFSFFPSIFYWSVTALRDTLCNLYVLVYLLCLIKFINVNKYKYIIWLLPFVYFAGSLRPRIAPLLLAGAATAVILSIIKYYRSRNRSLLKICLVYAVSLVLIFLFLNKGLVIPKIVNVANFLAHVSSFRPTINGIWEPSRTDYRIYSDLVYQQGKLTPGDIFSFWYLAAIFKALVYFFFSPFPFGNWTFNFLPFYPQVIYWYLMVPFVIKGWLLFLKRDKFATFALTVSLLIIILPAALYESNIGTAFRHKDMFMPIAFVFSAYAFTKWKIE